MIYVRPLAGLCNRLRSIDSAIEMANKHNQKLTIIWVASPDLNAKLSDLYNLPELEKHVHRIRQIDPKAGFKQKLIAKVVNRIELAGEGSANSFINKWALRIVLGDFNLNIGFNNLDLAKVVKENIDQNSTDHIAQEESYLEELRPMLTAKISRTKSIYFESCYRLESLLEKPGYQKFIPTEAIQKRVEQITSKFHDTIGVHIRRTDHHYAIENSPTQLFMEKISAYLDASEANTVFLCTDDGETKTQLIEKFGEKIIHAEISSLSRNDPHGIEDAVVDLMCLSKTNKIYGSHFSSFSQTAADIGEIEVEPILKKH